MACGAEMAHHGVRELAPAFEGSQSGGKPPHSKGARAGGDATSMPVTRGSPWPRMVTDRVVHTIRFPLYDLFMSPLDQKAHTDSSASQRFRTTQWSIVLAAGRRSSPESQDALATLCQLYWYPLYAYVRAKGHSPDDAQDLTQEFFARLLEKNIAGKADRAKGKFRSFLLASLNHFLANEWRDAGARKRGGDRVALSLDLAAGESRYSLEPAHELSAEKIYERRWALTLIEEALAKLRDELDAGGKLAMFEQPQAVPGRRRHERPLPADCRRSRQVGRGGQGRRASAATPLSRTVAGRDRSDGQRPGRR